MSDDIKPEIVRWEDPPDDWRGAGRPGRWTKIKEQLEANDGKWAYLGQILGKHIGSARLQMKRRDGFLMQQRVIDNTNPLQYNVWICYDSTKVQKKGQA